MKHPVDKQPEIPGENEQQGSKISLGLILGASVGVVLGSTLGNLGFSIALAAGIGLMLGILLDAKR